MVTVACDAVGITMQTAYLHRRECTPFRDRWNEIRRIFKADLGDSLMSRATYGWLEPVYYKGKVVGQRRVFCSKISTFMARVNGMRDRDPIGSNLTPPAAGPAVDDVPTTVAELIAQEREREAKAAEDAARVSDPPGPAVDDASDPPPPPPPSAP